MGRPGRQQRVRSSAAELQRYHTSSVELLVWTATGLELACLVAIDIPADEVGPAHVKYSYRLPGGLGVTYGWTPNEALEMLLAVASDRGWRVYRPLD